MSATGTCPGCGRRVRRLGGKGKSAFVHHEKTRGVDCSQRTPGGPPITGEQVYKWTGESGVVEPFASVLQKSGHSYFNHGGLLRVTSDEDGQAHELKAGDCLIVDRNGRVRVHLPQQGAL